MERVWNMKQPMIGLNNWKENKIWTTGVDLLMAGRKKQQKKKKQQGLSMRPYHEEERNLLLACSLFPGSEWKQFFQVKKEEGSSMETKNNKA